MPPAQPAQSKGPAWSRQPLPT
ncbi:hypothetical protein CORC01_11040 [Colletotrichum orchidophilum]|uniref:L-type lectin-like domain-containing protein n=1 Tax=Colletotrichum orchidophilum TaxID=1209926 RepID=A0A1G4AWX1_9PEZI|nr:hypothetical protein CORC01_11040 [Colletotrichum orchidophilum]